MHIISIINNKGGVGKTTSAHNLAVALTREGYKVGLVDLDSQANLSFAIPHTPKKDLRSLMVEKRTEPLKLEDFSTTQNPNLFLLPNNKDINSSLFNSVKQYEQMNLLKRVLQGFEALDFVIVDTPPTLDLATINAMIASTHILIPVQYEIFSTAGLITLMENIQEAKENVNPNLQVLGIFVTRVDNRQLLNEYLKEVLETNFKQDVLETVVRTNTRLTQAQADKKDIFEFGDKNGVEDYTSLAKEILKKLKK
jgi:chromosome partitioning protein